ncbi:Restriction enzyme type I helicase subunit [Plesiocystis pacifica SIR-1]|uniref:type I site-specific deoxyribonuclease n=1 Tax=Plesiocystis pacifica SIR-1 TaxID=391625 RepID=A6G8I9_9BACT|nr:type I restriction endonuclease [Plesiocystis pacifica]EDM77766.1 Restriction enzyme type I helicase subunit [Plesiocystis pacifica SIR-1]
MTSKKSSTVATYLRDILTGGVTHDTAAGPGLACHSRQLSGLGWHYLAPINLPRLPHDILVAPYVREALTRLNPEIAAAPERADEVLYELRAILRSARSDGLIKANEAMTEWFRNDKTMPFGDNHEHTAVRLFDFENIEANHFIVTTQYRAQGEGGSLCADLVLLVNGFPLVVIEAKPPLRPSISWLDRASTIRQQYEDEVPELFVCNVLNVATDGRELRYGSIGMPENLWGPWRALDDVTDPEAAATVTATNMGMLAPATLLDILEHFTLFAVNDKKQLIKVVCRCQQYQATNLIVDRVADPNAPKKGLIWHFQGSGKSYLMVFAAKKLRLHPALDNPAVLVVVDRVDLDTQIGNTFHGAKVENLVKAKTRAELKSMLRAGTKKVIITTIFRFGDESAKQEANRLLRWTKTRLGKGKLDEAETYLLDCAELLAGLDPNEGQTLRDRFAALHQRFEAAAGKALVLPEPQAVASEDTGEDSEDEPASAVPLNDAHNVIVLVDEAHRTQEGDLGRKMQAALPHASFFGLTGTPINKRDRNTFNTFGAKSDEGRYLHRYGFEDSIRDGATLPLHFVPRSSELKVDEASLSEEFSQMTGGLSDIDEAELIRQATRFGVAVKAPARVARVVADIAEHFRSQVRPQGLAAMIVTYDREACLLYKAELDKHLSPAVSDVVISVGNERKGESEYLAYKRDRDAEEKLLERYRKPSDPLKILVVTAKLLTGFDAPILQTMYLDKPLRDHTLLQAICRTNRVYNDNKQAGVIVDYLGLFEKTAEALKFDEVDVGRMVASIEAVKQQLPEAMEKCLAFFEGVDRTQGEQRSHVAALNKLGSIERCDAFGEHFRFLSKVWEVISPDPMLTAYADDYSWLARRYKAVRQSGGGGQQIWQELGPQTTQLLYEHLSFNIGALELEDIVLDDELFAVIQRTRDPDATAEELATKLEDYLRTNQGVPKIPDFLARLQDLKKKYEKGMIQSHECMTRLRNLGKGAFAAVEESEREPVPPPVRPEDEGRAKLSELFEGVGTVEAEIVEMLVADIDKAVQAERFPGWSESDGGKRPMRKLIRGVMFDHLGHADRDLHNQAVAYVETYYAVQKEPK